jgi:TPP-dependent pyruvate/acetoin dehydrogenase alpha subunit
MDAARQGSLHEALTCNVMEITSRFIVENNGYAMGTSVERTANHGYMEIGIRLRDALRTS